ncbi:MAG: hypothetical protein U9P00_01695 [Pseudomonadota bacterium]|nr:hypothetical protein [Pseudomonadota bacterium]
MKKYKQTTVALSVCTTLAAAIGTAQAGLPIDHSPFSMQDLDSGYMVADNQEGKCGEGKCGGKKEAEGKCGEGKCGGKKEAEGKCGEGKCGGEKKSLNEGKCGGEKKSEKEGKCGEGKCGGKQ